LRDKVEGEWRKLHDEIHSLCVVSRRSNGGVLRSQITQQW